jgi:hypothetical protein
MAITVFQNIIRFVLLMMVQIFVLNNIQLSGYINPYIYILFILSLPYRTPQWLTLILAFVTGLMVAFTRNGIINLITDFEKDENPTPSFYTFGIGVYIRYIVLLVFIHHTALFFLEAFSLAHFGIVIKKIFFSSVVSILLILGIQSLKKK